MPDRSFVPKAGVGWAFYKIPDQLFKAIKVIKSKESLENCYRPEKARGTQGTEWKCDILDEFLEPKRH